MRRFFTFSTSRSSEDGGNAPTDPKNKDQQSPRQRNSLGKDKVATISPLVAFAATSLSEAIDEILMDTNSLTGENATGFLRMIDILQENATCTDLVSISRSRGIGCLQVLLDNAHHPSFVETCNQTNLVNGLMHSMRILRMYEIKIGKEQMRNAPKLEASNDSVHSSSSASAESTSSSSGAASVRGPTFVASERACAVFRRLCSDSSTVEKIRPNLIKFITFPLFPFPRAAIHLQDHAASVLNQLCMAGLSSQQVWFLHDERVTSHVIKSLQDLTAIAVAALPGNSSHAVATTAAPAVPTTPGSDCLLRAGDAEQYGLWFTAISCVINLLCASAVTGSVLISDFENGGGHRLLTAMLERTSPDRLIMSLNVVIKLLFDRQKRADDPVAFPNAAGIIFDLLLHSLGVDKGVDIEDGIDKMVGLGHILYESREKVMANQHIVQNISYSLLTLYSNDPRNCNILEERYHFLPTLVICIPALSSSDSISAVLTALNYVCQCIDTASTLPLLSLCAAATVIVFSTLHCDKNVEHEREIAMHRLDAVYSSIDAMIRSHSRFALTLVRCGMLEHLICGPIEQLRSSVWQGNSLEKWAQPIYSKLVSIIVALNRKSPYVADEIRKCGLQLMVRDLIKSPAIGADFALELLVLVEDLAQRDTSHLEEAIQSFVDLLRHTRNDYLKMARILTSLSAVMLRVDEAAHVWSQVNGSFALLEVLGSLDGIYVEKSRLSTLDRDSTDGANSTSEKEKAMAYFELNAVNLSNAFECIKCTMRCMAADAATNMGMFRYDPDTDHKLQQFRLNNRRFTRALRNTGIFSPYCPYASPCIEVLFWLLSGGASAKPSIINPHSVVAVVELLPYLNYELASQALRTLQLFADCRIDSTLQLCNAGLIRMLTESFRDIVADDRDALKQPLLDFIKKLMSTYLTADDFMCVLQSLVRLDALVDCSNGKLIVPWRSGDPAISPRIWESVQLLEFLGCDNRCKELDGVPYVALGMKVSSVPEQPAFVSVYMSESTVSFPLNSFSFAAWVKQCTTTAPNDIDAEAGNEVIPLLSLNTFNAGGCFLEVHFDAINCFVRILLRKGKKICTLRFKPPIALNALDWHLVVICFKRSKRFNISKNSFMVYFNGLQGSIMNNIYSNNSNPETVEFDAPPPNSGGASSSPIELAIGKHAIELDSPLTADSADGDQELLSANAFRVADLWRLGPTHLFDDVLTSNQVAVIFIRGPAYVGTFQAESALSTTISHLACSVLRMCNVSDLTADKYIEQLGLKGMELVVDPKVEASQPVSVEISSLPLPVLSYSARNMLSVQLSATSYANMSEANTLLSMTGNSPNERQMSISMSMPGGAGINALAAAAAAALNSSGDSPSSDEQLADNDIWGYCRMSLLNMAANSRDKFPEASLVNGQYCFAPESLASCVATCGGPHILFPLLQAASSPTQIVLFFRILRSCISNHPFNLKYMQSVGYKVCAYIISVKPKSMLSAAASIEIIDAIFDISVDRKWNADTNSYSVLLVGATSFYYLLMNTQVWDFSLCGPAVKILELIVALTNDPIYSSLNRKRLSSIGTVKFLLNLLIFGADQSCRNALNASNSAPTSARDGDSASSDTTPDEMLTKDSWNIQIPSAREISDNEDSPDTFLRLVMSSLEDIVNTELRQKDLEQLLNSILHTLIPQYNNSSRHGLSAMCVTRVYLLRYLLDLLDRCRAAGTINASTSSANVNKLMSKSAITKRKGQESAQADSTLPLSSSIPTSTEGSPVINVFKAAVTVDWFLTVQDKIVDCATWTYYLRLLGSMLECIPGFQTDFCALDGLNLLAKQLQAVTSSSSASVLSVDAPPAVSALDVCVVIPLLGILFKIPMSSLPYRLHHSLDMVMLLGNNMNDDMDEYYSSNIGPDINEPWLTTVTIPVLGIIFNCLSSNYDPSSQNSIITDVIVDMMKRANKNNEDFRRLLQCKGSIELLASSMLSCSNAVNNDYGPHIFMSPMNKPTEEMLEEGQEPTTPTSPFSPLSDDAGVDLSSLIIADYISTQGALTVEPQQSTSRDTVGGYGHGPSLSAPHAPHPPKVVKPLIIRQDSSTESASRGGQYFVEMISSVMLHAITEFDHVTAVFSLMLSFPRNLAEESFATSYHMFLVQLFDTHVVTQLLEKRREEPHILHLQAIASTLTALIPLSRARVLDDCVQLEILQLSIKLLNYLTHVAASRATSLLDKLNMIIKDVGTTCRYFAISCIQAVINSTSEELRMSLLRTVRSNLDNFMMSIITSSENETSSTAPTATTMSDFNSLFSSVRYNSTRKGTVDSTTSESYSIASLDPTKNAGAAAVLEAFQLTWNMGDASRDKSNASTASSANNSSSGSMHDSAQLLAVAQADKVKLSQVFTIGNVCYCCGLVFDEHVAIRQEALRLFSLLAIHKSHLIEQQLSSLGRKDTADTNRQSMRTAAAQLFMDGVDKLIPVDVNSYLSFLRGDTNVGENSDNRVQEEEIQRFADFSYWFADNSSRCARILQPVESYLQSIVAISNNSGGMIEVDDIVRQIQTYRAKEDMKHESAKSVLVIMKRAEDGQRMGELITTQVRKWRAHGLMSLSVGAVAWFKLWNALQSSPVWGTKPRNLIIVPLQQQDSTSNNSSDGVTTADIDAGAMGISVSLFDVMQRSLPGSYPRLWKLNFIEGPERTRRKLELDFSKQVAALLASTEPSKHTGSAPAVQPGTKVEDTTGAGSTTDPATTAADSGAPASENSGKLRIQLSPDDGESGSPSKARLLEHKSSMEDFLQNISAEAMKQLQQSTAKKVKTSSYDEDDDEENAGDSDEEDEDEDLGIVKGESVEPNESFICNLDSKFSSSEGPSASRTATDTLRDTDHMSEHDAEDSENDNNGEDDEVEIFQKAHNQIQQVHKTDKTHSGRPEQATTGPRKTVTMTTLTSVSVDTTGGATPGTGAQAVDEDDRSESMSPFSPTQTPSSSSALSRKTGANISSAEQVVLTQPTSAGSATGSVGAGSSTSTSPRATTSGLVGHKARQNSFTMNSTIVNNNKKALFALEIVKGIVSVGEWNTGRVFNVERFVQSCSYF
jgi:hypothetical protein